MKKDAIYVKQTKLFIAVLLALPLSVHAADLNISEVPVQVRDGVKPNVMILMDTSGSMNRLPSGSYKPGNRNNRINQAKRAMVNVINANKNVRFCLSRLTGSHGGQILAGCGTDNNKLKRAINKLPATGSTPVAEAYYEVSRYFRGMQGHFRKQKYSSPVTHSCQKNFAIVVSDGSPTNDGHFKGVRDSQGKGRLPNWDRSDDDKGKYYVDDIAKFFWDIDLSSRHAGKQNLHTYTVGFSHKSSMLQRAAKVGHGGYYEAGNEAELTRSLNEALADIGRKTFSNTALGTSSGSVRTGLNLFQARYNTSDWSGELRAFGINTNRGSSDFGKVNSKHSWEAGAKLDTLSPDKRIIITNFQKNAVPFRWNKMSSWVRTHVFKHTNSDPSRAERLLNFIRGQGYQDFRSRSTKLGDIVNSNPIYVGAPVDRYNSDPAYAAFKKKHAKRAGVVYVGANDGMLHGFRASDGKEVLAFMPSQLLLKAHELAQKPYQHRYFVDGSPSVADVFIKGKWRTVLVGGLNAGAQAIYALDITDPSRFSEGNAQEVFLWEFGDEARNGFGDPDMGFSFSRPSIVKMRDGKWYAVFGNGYNNTQPDTYRSSFSGQNAHVSKSGAAVLYIVDMETGKLVKKLTTGEGLKQAPKGVTTPNGLSTVTPVSMKRDGVIDLIYAGDLYGNVWRFDVSDSSTNNWKRDYKLFQACSGATCSASTVQPITSRLTVSLDESRLHPLVLFGTGKSFEVQDRASKSLNTVYGLVDKGTPNAKGRAELLQQTIDHQVAYSYVDDQGTPGIADDKKVNRTVRITSKNRKQARHRGWYMDLRVSQAAATGERVLSRPTVRGRRVIVPFLSYGSDPCLVGGAGGLMEIDKFSGSRLSFVSVDLNQDGKFDDKDKVKDPDSGQLVTSSSISTDGGNRPVIISDGDSELKYHSENDGIRVDKESVDPDESGRQSWRYFKYP